MTQLDTVIDCANIALNCDHIADPIGVVCWTCAMKMVSISEAAEARADRLSALNLDAANKIEELEAEVEHQKALVDSWIARAAQLEARIEGLDRGLAKSDEIIAQLEAERAELIDWRDAGAVEIEQLTAERDEAWRQLEQARKWARVWKNSARWHSMRSVISFGE